MAAVSSLGGDGLFILIGALAGVVVAARASTFAPAVKPFLSLLRTVRPLVLPLFVVLAVGAVNLGIGWQLLISAGLLLIAWYLILAPERERFKQTLKWEGRVFSLIFGHLWKILIGAFLVALLLKWGLPDTTHFEAIGGLATILLLAALGVWLIATLLRLVSYATSWLRGLVALSIALAGARLAMEYGFVPESSLMVEASTSTFLSIALVLLLLEAILDVIAKLREGARQPPGTAWSLLDPLLGVRNAMLPESVPRAAERWGYTTVLAATFVLAVSVGYGLIATAQPGEDLTAPNGERVHPQLPRRPPRAVQDDLVLAREYAPVLALTHEERWSPVSADSYFAGPGAKMSGPPGTPTRTVSSLSQLESSCPGLAASPCYRLSIDCPQGAEPCAQPRPRPERTNDRLYREGSVYYRVLRKGEGSSKGEIANTQPNAFVARGPYAEDLSILIQYWYFYRYDEWETSVLTGQLVQKHEGDWEVVTVGLSNQQPLFVAYSAHCAGTWKRWKEIEVSGKLPRPWTHPLVAVAEGSHANYPKADQKRSPDWASCSGKVPAGTSTAIDYASNIRDKTEYGWLWYPAAGGWHEADTGVPPMSFPGLWGERDSTTLVNFKEKVLGHGDGPRTPSQQASWERPVQTIFCDRYTGPKSYEGCKKE